MLLFYDLFKKSVLKRRQTAVQHTHATVKKKKKKIFQGKMLNQGTACCSLLVKNGTQVHLIYLFVKNTVEKYLNKQNNLRIRLCNAKIQYRPFTLHQ